MFRLRRDCKHWFRHIQNQEGLKTQFDVFYVCALAGLSLERKSKTVSGDDTGDISQNFVPPYNDRRGLFLGLLLHGHLRNLGISLQEHSEVREACTQLFETEHPSGLSKYGIQLLNDYASGGFEVISSKYPDAPRTLQEFLKNFHTLLESSTAFADE